MIEQLKPVAIDFRTVIDGADRSAWDSLREFPEGACGVVCDLLGRFYAEWIGIETLYVSAERNDPSWCSHAWLERDGIIIDITADQFGQPPVIVSRGSAWHQEWTPERAHAPITDPKDWGAYPFQAWIDITAALERRGYMRPQASER